MTEHAPLISMRLRRAAVRAAPISLLLVVASLSTGFWRHVVPRQSAARNVLLITLDTTRADRLSTYGFMDVSLPHIERFAERGIVFDQAISAAPLTLPAHCSLMTGLFPPAHGVRDNSDRPLAAEQTTLAELLQAQEFRTAAFVGSVVLNAERGLSQGFDHYGDVPVGRAIQGRQRRADDVIDEASRWLDSLGESRFFLWTHLYDAHRPYDPPEPFRSRYAADPYVGEIAFMDEQVGRLLELLEHRSLLDRTIVILVGDHGESLGEHGERDHGIFVYESVLRVPLLVRAPGLSTRRVADVVRLVDVMPTVLDLLELPVPVLDGISLVDVMRGSERQLDLEAFSESLYPQRLGWSPLRALRAGRFKLIDAPRPELYDLARDPFEERNLHDERRALAEAMTWRVRALARRERTGHTAAADVRVVPDLLRERLASLGYVTSVPRTSQQSQALPDPKDCIGFYTAPSDAPARHNTVASLRCD